MDSEISGTVLSATPRVVGNNRTIYDIAISDGNTYATFDAALYAKAQPLIGQLASARVRVGPSKKNPQYTDYFINDIAPQGQLAATAAPVATQVASQPQIARPQSGGMSPEREQKIVKQSSFATAFNFVGLIYQGSGVDLEQATSEALSLAKSLYANVMGGGAVGILTPVEGPSGVAGEPVAAGVAGAAEVPAGDAIPWL